MMTSMNRGVKDAFVRHGWCDLTRGDGNMADPAPRPESSADRQGSPFASAHGRNYTLAEIENALLAGAKEVFPTDGWAPWSDRLNLPWPVMLESNLKRGHHTITRRTTDKGKTRSALHIIHVLLN